MLNTGGGQDGFGLLQLKHLPACRPSTFEVQHVETIVQNLQIPVKVKWNWQAYTLRSFSAMQIVYLEGLIL